MSTGWTDTATTFEEDCEDRNTYPWCVKLLLLGCMRPTDFWEA